jgi:nicotinamide mononucleotide transporter
VRVSKDNLLLGVLTWLTFGLAWIAKQRGEADSLEAIGFVAGVIAVWLTVKENVWNWPIGIANSVAYIFVFFRQRLFADGSLQVLYVILGLIGWYMWLFGGPNLTRLVVVRTPKWEYPILAVIGAGATYFMTLYLTAEKDAAPFLDALTTVLSLIAQYMLTRKYLENWMVWIAVDVIYVPLYFWKHLSLTGILYAVFTAMAVVGLIDWLKTYRLSASEPTT